MGVFKRVRYRRELKRRYQMQTDPIVLAFGIDLRNRVAAGLRPGEQIMEDEAVRVASVGKSSSEPGEAWIVLTTERVFWSSIGSRDLTELELGGLRLTFREEGWDTDAWGEGRKARAASIQFLDRTVLRDALADRVDRSHLAEHDMSLEEGT